MLRKELNVKREKGDSYIETLMLLRQGLTIEQVAESRNLKPVTIYSHIAELIISRKLTDWSDYISVFEIESVANVISSSENKTQNLKPIYEALNGKIDYGKIRLALAVLSLE
ncbi:helix-turn-helix domain-containing protein [uncultured Coprobacter sp.]|uniref:helix-turn-helix domain-containing protein n=1 Tax=uncultured Coprobacter sp. TaxID=1720550 RepID=UPI0026234967|nr:helix-turn-helix domain-containing protein [uncultured Coprobacter sp.]